jgi:hypothetical protein
VGGHGGRRRGVECCGSTAPERLLLLRTVPDNVSIALLLIALSLLLQGAAPAL